MAASIVLKDGSQEAVGEEKAWEPEDLWWLLIVYPFLQSFDTKVEVPNVAREWFHRRVGDSKPGVGDVALEQL